MELRNLNPVTLADSGDWRATEATKSRVIVEGLWRYSL